MDNTPVIGIEDELATGQPTGRTCCDLPPSLQLAMGEADRLSAAFKALSHPVRLQIVDLLSRYGGQICVCDVESQFDLKQPTISHHFKILREAGLIDSERRGQWLYYFALPRRLEEISDLLTSFADGANRNA